MRGRPVLRQPGGRWSLQQVYIEAGITLSVARTVVRKGLMDPDALTEVDIVVLRVAAALLDAPRPFGQARTQAAETVQSRDEQALSLTRDLLAGDRVDPAAALLVSATEALLAPDLLALMNGLAARRGSTVLMLPVGEWVAALPSRQPLQATAPAPTLQAAG
jgi:hypothetical protein